jgi:hypothetical protein
MYHALVVQFHNSNLTLSAYPSLFAQELLLLMVSSLLFSHAHIKGFATLHVFALHVFDMYLCDALVCVTCRPTMLSVSGDSWQ